MKITDITAKYGNDYRIKLVGSSLFGGEIVTTTQDNKSMIEMMSEAGSMKETASEPSKELLEEMHTAANESVQGNVYKEKATDSGSIKNSLPDSNTSAAINTISTDSVPEVVYNTGVTDPLLRGKEMFTGIQSDRQSMTAKENMLDGMGQLADMLTDSLIGATLDVPFKAGEKERLIEIEVLDNKVSNGQRIFSIILGATSEGMSNSGLSSAMFTIEDDEPKVLAKISFASQTLYAGENRVVVELHREGALNSIASVNLKTVAVNAIAGRDYSPVSADVIFPMGIQKRTVEIPVNRDNIYTSAQFKLVLENPIQCEINGVGEAIVNIEASGGQITALSAGADRGIFAAQATVTRGADLNLSTMYAVDNTANFGGVNYFNSDKYSLGWAYKSIWSERTGTSLAKINLLEPTTGTSQLSAAGNTMVQPNAVNYFNFGRYDWDGVEINWEQNSGMPAYVKTKVYGYTGQYSALLLYDTEEERWGRQTKTLYFGSSMVNALGFQNEKRHVGNSSTLNIYSITPIKRKFQVNFKPAESLTFDTGNGVKVPKPEYTEAELKGTSSESSIVEKYADEEFSIAVKNTAKARLKEIRIVTETESQVIHTATSGQTVVNIKLDNAFLERYKNLIAYNDVPGVNGSKKGSFTVQPVFEYIDAEVRVFTSSQGFFDTFRAPQGKQYVDKVYHVGDVVNLKFVPFSVDDYKAGNVKYMTKATKNNNTERSGSYDVTSGNEYLYEVNTPVVQLTPIFQKNNNKITMRIDKNDLQYFDENSRLFASKERTDGGSYWEYLVDSKPKFQKKYSLMVNANDSRFIPTWWEAKNDKQYYGNTFYFSAKTEADDNVIWVSAVSSNNLKSGYFSLTGSAYHNNVSIRNQNEGKPYLPAEGAAITSNGVMALVDAKGKFELPPFYAPYGGTIRYLVVCDGKEGLREYTLPSTEGVKKEFVTTILDPETNQPETVKVSAQVVNLSEVVLPNDGTEIPVFKSANAYLGRVPIAGSDNAVPINGEIVSFEVEVDPKGKEIAGVDYIVMDKNNNIRFTVKGVQISDTNIFGNRSKLVTTGSESYLPGDKLFVQMEIKNSSVDNNEGSELLTTTKLTPQDTGLVFVSAGYKEPVTQNFTVPTNAAFIELPLIGSFNSAFAFSNVMFTITQKPNNLLEMRFGYLPKSVSMSADNYKDYGAMDFSDGLKEAYGDGFSDMSAAKKGMAAMGAPQFKVSPAVGISLTFGIRINGDGHEFELMGGGIFLGVTAGFKVTWYSLLPVVFIPCYVGVSGSISALMQGGFLADPKGPLITVGGLNNQSYELEKSLEFNASLEALGSIQIFMGVGLSGTIGVRGGGEMTASYIWYPTVKKYYPQYHTNGLKLTFALKIWVDAFLMSIPIPVYQFNDLNFGYFDDIAKDKEQTQQMSASSMTTAANQTKAQVRYKNRDYLNQMSGWLPKEDKLYSMSIFAATDKQKQTTLLENGYDRPDSKLIDMGSGKMLLVFLADDKNRKANERTALQYSVFDGNMWSVPVTIQNDGTADFSPNLWDGGENVIITWSSTPPGAVTSENPAEFLKKTEIYTTMFNKNSGTMGENVRLSEDNYFDSMPHVIYDEVTGDIAVYYVKSSVSDDFVASLDMTQNYSVIVYMLYDHDRGQWLRDYYYDNELDKPEDAEAMIRDWKGQRFLASPIEIFGMQDPVITDFDAISYNGLGVYTYTIDKDNIKDTSNDRELFIQVYDFDSHSTYWPVRITDDLVNDSIPRLIRKGEETYLFWLHDDTVIKYINITTLIREGINPNGTIKEDYDMRIGTVVLGSETTDIKPILHSFEVVQDQLDNLYIVWTQPIYNEETKKVSQEIFATAMIKTKTQENTESVMWAQEYQITKSRLFNDELSLAVNGKGKVYIIHNEFIQEYTDDPYAPVLIKDMKLRVTEFMPENSLKVHNFNMSDETPNSGEMVKVGIDIKNEGLLAVEKGYLVEVYESRNGVRGRQVATIENNARILPGRFEKALFEWTLPEEVTDLSLEAVITNKDMGSITSGGSGEVKTAPDYEIQDIAFNQKEEGMTVSFSVYNKGNMPSLENDIVRVNFNGPFVSSEELGIQNKVYYEQEVGLILPGESKSFEGVLNVPAKAFDRFGYLTAYTVVTDSAAEVRKGKGVSSEVFPNRPVEIKLKDIPGDTLTLQEGVNLKLALNYEPYNIYPDAEFVYTVQDTSVAVVEGDMIRGIKNGETTLTAYIQPYGAKKTFKVKVEQVAESDTSGEDNHQTSRPSSVSTPKETVEKNKIDNVLHISGIEGLKELSFNLEKGDISADVDLIRIKTSTADIVLIGDILDEIRKADEKTTIVLNIIDQQEVTVKLLVDGEERADANGYMLVNYNLKDSIISDSIIIKFNDEIITEGFYDENKGKLYIPLEKYGTYKILENQKEFSDVKAHWGKKNIDFLSAREILNGYEDGSFIPEKPVTRAEFLKILQASNILKKESAEKESQFTDVDKSSWYYKYVQWGAANEIVNGYEDNTFDPDKSVTREEMAVMLSKFITLSKKEFKNVNAGNFADSEEISSWAKEAVMVLRGLSIVEGNGENKFFPKDKLTRAQAAKLITLILKSYTEDASK